MTTAAAAERERLAQLLKQAGSRLDPDGVAELIGGVLAAPPEIGTAWHQLVAEPTPPELAAALDALRAARAATNRLISDIVQTPAPTWCTAQMAFDARRRHMTKRNAAMHRSMALTEFRHSRCIATHDATVPRCAASSLQPGTFCARMEAGMKGSSGR